MIPVRILDSLLDRIAAIGGALVFAQLPEFMVQYIQRLGGHVDELERIIVQYRQAAIESGTGVAAYIRLHLESKIPEFVKTGKIMGDNLERYEELRAAFDALVSSPPALRVCFFLRGINCDIAAETMRDFTPGLPLNMQGAVYGAAGLAAGMFLYFIVKKTLQHTVLYASGKIRKHTR